MACLQKFPWLAYSGVLDGSFCVPCVLFGRHIGLNSTKLNKLMKSPLTGWSAAVRRFNGRQCISDIHKNCTGNNTNIGLCH